MRRLLPSPALLLAAAATVLAALVLAASAEGSVAPTPTEQRGYHRCPFEELQAKQMQGESLQSALEKGMFNASAVKRFATVDIPRGTDDADGDAAGYAPIRIAFYSNDVHDSSKHCTAEGDERPDLEGGTLTCTQEQVLTTAKQKLLIEDMFPKALAMHKQRLLVEPLQHITIGNSMDGATCREFSAPADVMKNGVANVDFVIFVAAAPTAGRTIAWATTCGYASGRPIIGVTNVSPAYIDGTERSIRTVAHEVMHALGFGPHLFQTLDMVKNFEGLRGKPSSAQIATPTVIEHAKQHYGCNSLLGMELDDSGGEGTVGAHWSARAAYEDLMSGYANPNMRYTAMTIAALVDTGFYKGNFAAAEPMNWGYHVDCKLQDEKCIVNEASSIPSMFCSTVYSKDNPLVCTADRRAIGYCSLKTVDESIPSYYQYFSAPNMGGDSTMEYCPVVFASSSSGCVDGSAAVMPHSFVGKGARCVDKASGSSLNDSVCVEVSCDFEAKTYKIKFLGSTTSVDCKDNAAIDAHDASPTEFPSGSTVVCPSFMSMCMSATDLNAL